MFRKAVETIFAPYQPVFSEVIWSSTASLADEVFRKRKPLEQLFRDLADVDPVLSEVKHWYSSYEASYRRKHKKPGVKRHFALLRQFLIDAKFSPEDVSRAEKIVMENAQRTCDDVTFCLEAVPGINSLPVGSLFVFLACVAIEATELKEARMKMNLRAFVAETLVPVINNVAEMGGWQPSRLQAMEALYDKEVGKDKLHLPDPATEENMLFDEQQKPTWIKFARKLSKGHIHYVLREAARYELLAPVIMQRYSNEEMPSTEQAQSLSYISCKNTGSGIELHRNPSLSSILQVWWSALQKAASVLLEEARTKASADQCLIMDALGTIFKEHFISTLRRCETFPPNALEGVDFPLPFLFINPHFPRVTRLNLRINLQVTQTGHYG